MLQSEGKEKRLQKRKEETIPMPSFSLPSSPHHCLNSQLGAPYLLQHYNSPGGNFRPIKPASRDSAFSLCPLLLMPQTSHSVISTLVTNAQLSLISLVDCTIGGDKESESENSILLPSPPHPRYAPRYALPHPRYARARCPASLTFRCLACAGASRAVEKIITGGDGKGAF